MINLSDNEVLFFNWNRISMLSRLRERNKLDEEELNRRIQLQNAISCTRNDEPISKTVIKMINETLNPEIIKQVKMYLKQNSKN